MASRRRWTTLSPFFPPLNRAMVTTIIAITANVRAGKANSISGTSQRSGALEHSHRQPNPGSQQSFRELGADPRGYELTKNLALFPNAGPPELEDVLHGDHVAFHAGDLGNAHDLARSITHA